MVSRDWFETVVLSRVSSGDEAGKGAELSQVEHRGTGCRDAQGWGLDLRATVLD